MTKKRWLRFDGRPLASLRVPEDAQDVADLCDTLLQQMKPPGVIAAALDVYTNAAAYSRGERLELHIKLGAIGEDPTDPIIVELSRVWFQLVSGNPGGAAFKNTTPYAVLAPEGSRVGDVLEAIFRESSGILDDGFSSSQLLAFESRDAMNSLSRDAVVGASGRAESSPLIVVVRQSHDRRWHLAIDQEYAGAVQKYKEVADLLKDSPEVKTMETVIESTAASGADRFIVLENSSGTGKTQMAFNLEASGLYHVLYVPSACPESSDQTVCKAFHERTMAFLDCVEKDAKVVRYGSVSEFALRDELYLYAFVAAALRGEDACCGQATRECVERALRRRKEDGAKPFVFFLDEFPRLEASCSEEEGDDEEKKIRMMRNCCRSFGIPVILSSTNATARTMLSVGGRISRHVSRVSDKTPWCVVVSSLPAIVRSCVDLKGTEPGAEVLELILQHSRPLFSNEAQKYLLKMKSYGNTAADWLWCLSELTAYLAPRIRGIKERRSPYEFGLGQVCLLLGRSIDATDTEVNLVDSHFSCLDDWKPVELDVGCGSSPYKDREKWKCRSKFPTMERAMLLYLTLMGDHDVEGTKLRPLNAPLCELLQEPFFRCHDLRCPVEPAERRLASENLVAGAVLLASHRDKFCGVEFPAFLGRFLYEVGVAKNIDAVVELPSEHEKNATTIPFLSPPNTEWPKEFLERWKESTAQFANMRRLDTDGKCSRYFSSDVDGRCVLSGECSPLRGALKVDDLERVLMNVPESSSIHLVVVEKLYSSYVSSVSTLGSTATEEATSEDVTIPESALDLLAKAKRQGTNFYRISRDGVLSEFEELMQAKARVGDVSDEHDGRKVVIFVEIGDWYAPGKRKAEGTQRKAAKKLKLTTHW